ncbi:protein translocase subunit SecD [Caldisericum exile]|uniref:Protein translocase subunit SecD n=1 Tax=Caldisericum exile (strain DSM 21853 / NBRC 104410 / AZM16c01) TaxID=511051 RepID=A0A7U6JEH0_CALEA|nr:protein translocase subunit SecD [Caldisericum exile]BAL80448.1 protein-export membrane protein SecD [Caldisericum exile AZM16c01]
MKRKLLVWFIIFLVVFVLAVYIDYTAITASSKPLETLNKFESYIVPRFGLDIKGGVRFVLEAVDTPEVKVTSEAMQTAISVIQKRVNALGISEAIVVQEKGANWKRIDVELPGWKDPQKAKELIGQTALLQFKTEDGKVVLTGAHIKNATLEFSKDPATLGQPVIAFQLDSEGAKIFADVTQQNIGKTISIYLDDKLLMAPTVKSAITDGQGIIEGKFTKEEAANYAALLRSGALPVKLNFIQEEVVGPSLGSYTIRMAIIGAIVAFLLVAIYMIIFYGYLGILSALSLIFYVSLELAVLFLLHATLSLPAIGGAILSLGMAVDINVIVFERMKEELKLGKTLKSIINAGFANALRTVIDSNLTVLVGAAILFYFGTTIIKGFAVTTSIGILSGFVSGVFVTRLLVELFLPQSSVKKPWMWGI